MSFPRIDETHDPARASWVEGADRHPDLPIQNLPYGIFSPPGGAARAGVAIGERIFDLRAAAQSGLLPAAASAVLGGTTLNALMALPASDRLALRRWLSALFSDEAQRHAIEPLLHPAADCALHLPATIGDYTDFYVGIHHATNIGKLFRPDNPLLPNYKYVPIGYHGRASSIQVSGAALKRPKGQIRTADADAPVLAPCKRLDYELELGIWVGPGNDLGTPVPIRPGARRGGEGRGGQCGYGGEA